MNQPKFLFHYTVGVKLPQIQCDGFLRTTPAEPKLGERPLVWLSSNTTYEQTARKHLVADGGNRLASVADMHEYCNGIYRFAFPIDSLSGDLEAIPWMALKHRAKMRKKIVDRLVKRAKGVKALPREWYGVMRTLPIEHAELELLDPDTNSWQPISLADATRKAPSYQIKQIRDSEIPSHLRTREEDWTS